MDDEFDDFVKGLQNRIFEETRAVYGEVAFQRWLNPLYVGVMRDCDGCGRLCHVDWTPGLYGAEKRDGEAVVVGTCRVCDPHPYGTGWGV